MTDDQQLLWKYTQERSEPAFSELVARHIDLVYSAALRVVNGDSHLAEDVTQIVFTDFARKAWGLPCDGVLAGWLYRHACYTASKAVRTERRRQTREQTAMEMSALDTDTEPNWELIAPHLDKGLNQLSAADRDAIVLRFLKQQDFRAVGAALGISEDAAQKRVSRALEKLRGVLDRRGVALTATALVSALTAEAVTAAPAGLAISVTAASLTAAATAGTGIGLVTMKLMAMTKLQMCVAGVILAAGIATPMVFQQQSLNRVREDNARMQAENESLRQELGKLDQLTAENARLSNLLAQAKKPQPIKQDQFAELLRLRGEATRLKADARTNAKPANALADMMKSPEMKEFMKTAMGTAIDKSYAKLFTDLHLTPEQTASLKDLIIKKQLTGMDMGANLLTGQTDPAKQQELAQQVNAEKTGIDEQIKQALGDDGYAQFQTYEKSQTERTTVGGFEDKLAGTGLPALNPDQEQQLIQAMGEERQNFKFTTDYTDQAKLTGDISSYFTADKLNQFQQQQEQLNQKYVARAQGILSPSQLGAYQEFLTKQQQLQNTMMQMSSKLFVPKAAGNN